MAGSGEACASQRYYYCTELISPLAVHLHVSACHKETKFSLVDFAGQ